MRSGEPKQQTHFIPTLDGWRAIAVMLVFASHCTPLLRGSGSPAALRLANFLDHAGYGVDIFFGLSGFLICTLLLREKESTGTISLGSFYLKRIFRIVPATVVYLAFVAVLSWRGAIPHVALIDFTSVLLFFRNYRIGSWYTGQFWSLAVEEQFYAIVPLVILRTSRRVAAALAAGVIVGCIAARTFEFTQPLAARTLVQFRTECRIDGLAWGCVLAYVLRSPARRQWIGSKLTLPFFFSLIALAAVLLQVFSSQPIRRTIVALVVPLLLAQTVLNPRSWVGRLLDRTPVRFLGRLSYSLYIWQEIFLFQFDKPLGMFNRVPLALFGPFVCAYLSYRFVERPLQKVGHRLAARREARRAVGLVDNGTMELKPEFG